ncbi:TrmH family RNA methyltransferase [Fodinicurvata halophila]|uniref:TrmH family RNA methyltransferase n=1 Tax=Fodinicurvata halophila TaxID=1419723 RepID=A0ABV8UG72_9PROT
MSRKRKKLSPDTNPSRTQHGKRPEPRRQERGTPSRQRDSKPRSGLWLYGWHACLAALGNPHRQCHRLVLSGEPEPGQAKQLAGLFERPELRLPEPEQLDRDEMGALLPPGAVHQGIALLTAPLSTPDLHELLDGLPPGRQVLVALDQVSDPHNVGAILRSAAVFGGLAVLNTERHAPAETGTLAKSASGGLESVPYIQVTNLARSLDQLKEAGFWVFGLASEASAPLPEADLPERLVLCLGAEGAGLRRLTRERCDLLVRLPTPGSLQDLNVSNAAAVALYELLARGAENRHAETSG